MLVVARFRHRRSIIRNVSRPFLYSPRHHIVLLPKHVATDFNLPPRLSCTDRRWALRLSRQSSGIQRPRRNYSTPLLLCNTWFLLPWPPRNRLCAPSPIRREGRAPIHGNQPLEVKMKDDRASVTHGWAYTSTLITLLMHVLARFVTSLWGHFPGLMRTRRIVTTHSR